jgi:outer membrane protein
MKQIKTLLIAALFIFEQIKQLVHKQKTAHVDVSEIMAKMPAMLDAQKLEKIKRNL